MQPLHYGAVIPSLFRSVPEAKQGYDALDMPGDPLPYAVFSLLEGPFLTRAVTSGRDTDLLRRLFQFFEQMASSPDREVVNLLYVEIFETWVADAATLKKAFKHMGPATKALASEAAHSLRCGNNLPAESIVTGIWKRIQEGLLRF